MRDATREISLHHGPMPQATSVSLAAQLLGRFTSASTQVARAEMQIKLQEALNGMDPIDREILALRHFEELSCGKVGTAPENAIGRRGKCLWCGASFTICDLDSLRAGGRFARIPLRGRSQAASSRGRGPEAGRALASGTSG